MRCPSLSELPPPPPGKTGWPWTEETSQLPDRMPEGSEWPRISIVTPSFNQAAFLEETIRSVLMQDYPNLEYIVIDGGSTDGSVDIIRKYEPHLAYWVSEKDRGQTQAINKGLARASGDIIAYLNSDDIYLPGALHEVATFASQHPDVDLIHGICADIDEGGKRLGQRVASITRYDEILDLWGVWWRGRNFVQPEVFWSRRIMQKVGLLREDLHMVMDVEYWLRILRTGARVGTIRRELAAFRWQPNQKSVQAERSANELLEVVGPMLWEPGRLGLVERLRLQGLWLFDQKFRKYADRAVVERRSKVARWAGLVLLPLRYPQLLLVSDFWSRALGRAKLQSSRC